MTAESARVTALRANLEATFRQRDRLDDGYEDEKDRLRHAAASLEARWANERLELDTEIGDIALQLRAEGVEP